MYKNVRFHALYIILCLPLAVCLTKNTDFFYYAFYSIYFSLIVL